MKKSNLISKIAAATSMFTLMGLLVAFKSGAFDSYATEQFGDGQPDSTKKDTLLLPDYIVLTDSAFVVPAYVYSSKAMIMDYKLEFDTVYRDTILYGTPEAEAIMSKRLKVTPSKGINVDKQYMHSSKSAPIINPIILKDTSDTKNKREK